MSSTQELAKNLTMKQFNFAKAWFETGVKAESYRIAYNAENMSPEAIRVEAMRVSENPNVALMVDHMRADSIKASMATVEWKKSRLIQVADYGAQEEVVPTYGKDEAEDDSEIELRQANPKAIVSAIKELNLMDGHHAAIKAKLEIDAKVQISAGDIMADNAFSIEEIEKALGYHIDGGLKEIEAAKKVLAERDKQKAGAIDAEVVDDPWSE